MTTQTFNLELIPQGVPPIVYVSQYDKGQTWLINILKDGEAYAMPSGCSAVVQGTKEDGTGFQYSCSYSGSQVTVTEQQQMTVFAGDVPAEIRFVNEGNTIATLNFIIRVEPAALADDTVVSETDLPLLEEAIEAAQTVEYYAEHFIGYVTDAQYSAIQTLLS